ncbi:galactofuranose ABC transporter, permease protein YjfF [uncultured Pseudokineococcus sp.]|uniref:galactofuranose ABC transporter, permease protein YjfF n=1 Tax=uncultured Pseudokineococcus sp. TaxID=1642928 RepID=UPI00260B0A77|nr:galactofuranose ABC transporter, permease protein YjfF [uncultured Pseudokineococcus sp.]
MSTDVRTQPTGVAGAGASRASAARGWLDARSRFLPVVATFVLFVAMFAAGSLRHENFGSPQVFANLFIDNAYLVVLAVGVTFVILTGGIDLSVASVLALSAMVAAASLEAGWSAPLVVVAVLVLGAVFGTLQGLVIHFFQIQPFIVTLAGLFLARGLCYVISVDAIAIADPTFRAVASAYFVLPGTSVGVTPNVLVAVAVVLVAVVLLHLTRFGRTVYAVGGGESSATLMGLPVARAKVGAYAISGLCAAISGLLFSFYSLSGYSLTALGGELDAIAAVVIGGTLLSGGVGFVLGSLLGVLVLGTIQTLISFEGTLSSWWTKIFVGALLLLFVVLQRVLVRRRS